MGLTGEYQTLAVAVKVGTVLGNSYVIFGLPLDLVIVVKKNWFLQKNFMDCLALRFLCILVGMGKQLTAVLCYYTVK